MKPPGGEYRTVDERNHKAMETFMLIVAYQWVKSQMKNQQIKPSKQEDRKHLRMGYSLLHEALNEFEQIYRNDNILAHVVRTVGAIEDTLYEYLNTRKEA